MGLFDRKEKYIRINPNRYVRNGGHHHVPEVPDDLCQMSSSVSKLFIKRTWDKLKNLSKLFLCLPYFRKRTS